MKIITTEIANIREKATTASKVKEVAYKGRILESSGLKTGQVISNNGKWYELTTGGYIWSGVATEYIRPDVVLYSQADWRWGSKLLGYGTGSQTIRNYGCALTSCAMLCGIDPNTLNEYLKRVGGYVQQTLLIWSALEKATSGKLRYKSGVGVPYDDAKAKEIIKREGGCILEVTGSGLPMHFVVAIGNSRIFDPIDGKEKSIYSYKIVQLRDIERF